MKVDNASKKMTVVQSGKVVRTVPESQIVAFLERVTKRCFWLESRLVKRLDDEGIKGTLGLRSVQKAAREVLRGKETLRAQWERRLAGVPADWSDIYGEVRLDSTDYLERGALLLAPVNPARFGGRAALRFRSAHHFGYGVSPEMAARCFERCDEEGITGEVEILYVLSDTHPVATQGPVWLLGGHTV